MKTMGVVLTQSPIPQGTSRQSSGAAPEFLLLIMSGEWARLGKMSTWRTVPRSKRTFFLPRNPGSFSSTPMHASWSLQKEDIWVVQREGWGRAQIEIIGFGFDFFFSVF